MYNGGDQSYLRRPPIMSSQVVEAMIERVKSHCDRHDIEKFAFVFHGGEPMLAKPRFYEHFVKTANRILRPRIEPTFAIQTNGTLVNEAWCETFKRLGIRVSFSLDGPKSVNDRFRVDKKGRGSFDAVMAGWRLAQREGVDPGLLLVVDVEADPLEIYQLIEDMRPSTVDFLLPDATYDKPPQGYADGQYNDTPYADWLLEIFDRWYDEARTKKVPDVRMFLQVIRALLGKEDGYDVLGKGKIEVLVIESDGEIQPLDGLRFCEDGIADTSLNVLSDELDIAYQNPLIQLYHGAHDQLPAVCKACSWEKVCGGGFLPHRYQRKTGFDNPSLYCQDMLKLITRVHDRVEAELVS